MSYGREDNEIKVAIKPQTKEEIAEMAMDVTSAKRPKPAKSFSEACRLSHGTCRVVLECTNDSNVLSFVHVMMVFLSYLTTHPRAMALLQTEFPWALLAAYLNSLLQVCKDDANIHDEEFPEEVGTDDDPPPRPLPEDYGMKGLRWSDGYWPDGWFRDEKIDAEEQLFEVASMVGRRRIRILWLAYRMARRPTWIKYNATINQFQVVPRPQDKDEDVAIGEATGDQDDIVMSERSTVGSKQTSVVATKGDTESMDLDDN